MPSLRTPGEDAPMISIPKDTNTNKSGNTADGGSTTSVSYVTAPEAIASNSVHMKTAELILTGPMVIEWFPKLYWTQYLQPPLSLKD